MAEVRGLPVIAHVINYWRAYTDDFIFVVKNGKDALTDFIRTLDIRARFVEPDALRGIADGLSYVEPLVDGPFIMVLGDCFCAGDYRWGEDFSYAIGVLPDASEAQVCRNYAVLTDGPRVTAVEEKPGVAPSDLCGMGFYFFQPGIFDHIRQTSPSERSGELEITDVLATLVAAGEPLHALLLDGIYINLTTPDDLPLIEQALATHPPAPPA